MSLKNHTDKSPLIKYKRSDVSLRFFFVGEFLRASAEGISENVMETVDHLDLLIAFTQRKEEYSYIFLAEKFYSYQKYVQES